MLLLMQTLTNLELHNNKIGTDGLEDFADALRTNKVSFVMLRYKHLKICSLLIVDTNDIDFVS